MRTSEGNLLRSGAATALPANVRDDIIAVIVPLCVPWGP